MIARSSGASATFGDTRCQNGFGRTKAHQLTKDMDTLIVMLTATMIACYALILRRFIPKT